MKNQTEQYTFYHQRLTLIRIMRGLSMQDVARQIGLTKQAISKYEQGKMQPSKATLVGMCKILKLPEEFFTCEILLIKLVGNSATIAK